LAYAVTATVSLFLIIIQHGQMSAKASV